MICKYFGFQTMEKRIGNQPYGIQPLPLLYTNLYVNHSFQNSRLVYLIFIARRLGDLCSGFDLRHTL